MWFEVDKRGLAQLLERKGRAFVLYELVQNALDEQTRRIDIRLERVNGARAKARLVVEDDCPEGFRDLTHAFTLFAESHKKGSADQRGRWNLGEKLVLALCEWAEIRSTRGGFRFDESGRHKLRARRTAGTRFEGVLSMSAADLQECARSVRRLLVPDGVRLTFNGRPVAARPPLKVVEATLPTELADAQGRLRATRRRTVVQIHAVAEGERACLYEMGIPVVETGDKYHVNVQQKVPLNFDRDNVSPSYLARVRALVLEHMAADLDADDANSTWVRDALTEYGEALPESVIQRVVEQRFGARRVAYDPSDPEANSRAVAAGYVVVHGSQLSRCEWAAVRRAGAILPAGQVTPSPRPYREGGRPLKLIEQDRWTEGMRWVAALATMLAQRLVGVRLSVVMAAEVAWPYAATYAPTGQGGGTLTFNVGRLGKAWFDAELAPVLRLLIHEFGHHYSQNHLADAYHAALCDLGARLAALALEAPALFARPN